MGNLIGKFAVVTGAGRGIGEAIIRRFMEDGAKGIALLEFDKELLEATIAKLDPKGNCLFGVPCDVSVREQVQQALETTMERFGRIDVLVNNAGITRDAMFHKLTDENWDLVMNVNLGSMYNTCKFVVPIMRAQNYGKIVNISSTSAFGNVGQSNYAASKSAAIGFTKTLARECGSKGITANCVAPGYIMTDMLKAIPETALQKYLEAIPMRRFGVPEEIASVVAFLSCDDSSFLSGQVLTVSGASNT